MTDARTEAPSHAGLLPHHRAALHARGLTDETISAAGLESETNKDRLAAILKWKRANKTLAPAIVIPFNSPDGANGYCRVRPDVPRLDRNKKPVKYESPKGEPNRVYLPPGVAEFLADVSQEIAITEGEFKALALTQTLSPTLGLVGVYGWKSKDHQRLLPDLERVAWQGRTVYLIFDSDISTNENVLNALAWLAKHLQDRGAKVRWAKLPDGPDGGKLGIDDFIAAKGADAKRAVRGLLDAAEDPPALESEAMKSNAGMIDPAEEAAAFLATGEKDGVYRLRFWRGTYLWWSRGAYSIVPPSEIRSRLINHINQGYTHLTTSITGNVIDQVKAQSILGFGCEPPAWLGQADGYESWRPEDCIICRNGIVNLPALVAGDENHIIPATPRLFAQSALDYDFDLSVPKPERWYEFLGQVWPDDQPCIDTLQELLGLLLTADTSFQKIAMLIGPTRCGKGTIARAIAHVIGRHNIAGPTLASFGTNFGLWPLLGKSVAIISDARLSGRVDQAVVTERLLSISGEDQITVDRKNLEPVTGKMSARLMILSNELPRLTDASGALIGRMLILPMRQTFYGREDRELSEKLREERAGILLWAIAGWARLHARGYFLQPASGDDMRDQLIDIASPVGAFARECCVVEPGRTVSVERLYDSYREWCRAKGREPSSQQMFGRDLSAAVSGVKRKQPREGGERYRAYEGIGLKPGF